MKSTSPRRFNVRWTCKLIRRDLKALLSTNPAAKSSRTVHDRVNKAVPLQDVTEKPYCVQPLVQSSTSVAAPSMNGHISSSPHSTSTGTRRTTHDMIHEEHATSVKTLYELLETSLKITYAGRDRNAEPKQRWDFRGSILLLNAAAQACPSNPIYELFREQKPDESALLLKLLQSRLNSSAKAATPKTRHLSSLPAEPFSKPNNDHIRHDSALSTVSVRSPRHRPLTTSQLWHIILEGATDKEKTIAAATTVLEAICSDMCAAQVIAKIGDPREQFTQEDEVRIRFRDRLYPDYNFLFTT